MIGVGPTKASILTKENLQIDLRVVLPEEYGAALQHFTGGKAHNIALREIAISQGYKLNEYGLFRTSTGERVAFEQESDIYRALGLQWMPPEMRENRGELAAAAKGTLPKVLEQGGRSGRLPDAHRLVRRQGDPGDDGRGVHAARVRVLCHHRPFPEPARGRTG